MLISEKIARIVKHLLTEENQSFERFMIQEYGRQVTKSELGQAIIGWADLYMQGANSGDFEGVAKYLKSDIYTGIVDELPAMFVTSITPFLKFMNNAEEEV